MIGVKGNRSMKMQLKSGARGRKRRLAVPLLVLAFLVAFAVYIDWRGTFSGFWGAFVPKNPHEQPGRYAAGENGEWTVIDNARFGIDSAGKDARKTTDGINEALRWASASGLNKVRLSPGTYLIRCEWSSPYTMPDDGIQVPSGMTLNLEGATLKIEPNGSPNYCIIAIAGKSGVSVLGGTLIGDRDSHDYDTGSALGTHEWGFGIAVAASTDVLIQDVTIRDTTGDGIILEGSYKPLSEGGKLSKNVHVYDCGIMNCRRQGISVVGAVDSNLAGNRIAGIRGTLPEFGIDVEPELDYRVDNVRIYDNTIRDCAGGAVNCHGGSGYEVYANRCIGSSIIAVECSDVSIYGNYIESSMIRVFRQAENVQVYDNQLDLLSRLMIEN